MTDEEVIRRRLLIDGDGTGDDRRLNSLLKGIIKWSNSSNQTESEDQLMHSRLLSQLSQCEFAAKKSQLQTKTNQNQLEDYKNLQMALENKIVDVKDSIEKSKMNLEQAKILKHNRMQYDLLAQNIKEKPARSDTDKKLGDLNEDLKKLNDESQTLEEKLEMRRKQFYVLVSSANRLRAMLDEVQNEDSMNTSLEDINAASPEPMSP